MSKIGDFLDFRKFATSNGVNGMVLDDQMRKGALTPYILEERTLNVTQMDVFSRLMYDRIIYFSGTVDELSCNTVIAQLLYLSSVDNRDISMYINSGGGSIIDGLGVIDTMNYLKCDIATTCVGMCASMGAVLLSNGTKEKRYILPHGRVMIHSAASHHYGHTADLRIEMQQTERCQSDIYKILAKNMEKSVEEVNALCDRDNWFIGAEALELGIVDKVLEAD